MILHPLIIENKYQIFEICAQNQVSSLYLFGSVLDAARFNADSDIDILVDFKNDLSIEDYVDCYFNLLSALEDLLERPVDITTVRSLSNPYFKAELERTSVLLYDFSTVESNG